MVIYYLINVSFPIIILISISSFMEKIIVVINFMNKFINNLILLFRFKSIFLSVKKRDGFNSIEFISFIKEQDGLDKYYQEDGVRCSLFQIKFIVWRIHIGTIILDKQHNFKFSEVECFRIYSRFKAEAEESERLKLIADTSNIIHYNDLIEEEIPTQIEKISQITLKNIKNHDYDKVNEFLLYRINEMSQAKSFYLTKLNNYLFLGSIIIASYIAFMVNIQVNCTYTWLLMLYYSLMTVVLYSTINLFSVYCECNLQRRITVSTTGDIFKNEKIDLHNIYLANYIRNFRWNEINNSMLSDIFEYLIILLISTSSQLLLYYFTTLRSTHP